MAIQFIMVHFVKNQLTIIFAFLWIGLLAQENAVLILPDTSYVVVNPGLEFLIAASEGDTSKVSAFLEFGIDVNYSNSDGVTPLMFAAQAGHLEIVLMLLHNGANVDLSPYNEVDALLGACIAGHVFIADTLIQNGADVNTSNYSGITPLMYAAAYNDYTLSDMLLFYNSEVEKKDEIGNTALIYSVFYGNSDMTSLLIEHGAQVSAIDNNGFTPLMVSAQNGHLNEVSILLDNGADIDAKNDKNLTALSLAIINNQVDVSEYLLKNGADPNHNISEVQNQYSIAKEFNAKEIKSMLLDKGAKNNTKLDIGSLDFGLNMTAAKKDFMVGLEIGLNDLKYGLGLRLAYKTRSNTRSVLYTIDEIISYQLWEKRSVFSLGIDKYFVLGRSSLYSYGGLFGGLDIAYTYGSFRGSDKKPNDRLYLIPKVGGFWNFKSFYINANFEYFQLENSKSSPYRISVSMGYRLNFRASQIILKSEPKL